MSTTTASLDLKPIENPPPSTSIPQITAEVPSWAPKRAELIARGHERDAEGERVRSEQGLAEVMQRIGAMTRSARRVRHALYAKDPSIRELNARIARLKAAVAEIEANAESFSAAQYIDADANLEEAKAELRKAKDHVTATNMEKIDRDVKFERKPPRVTDGDVKWSVEEKLRMKKEERINQEGQVEVDRDFWRSEAERHMAIAEALEIRLRKVQV